MKLWLIWGTISPNICENYLQGITVLLCLRTELPLVEYLRDLSSFISHFELFHSLFHSPFHCVFLSFSKPLPPSLLLYLKT